MRNFERERGQVLPIWIMGILATIALIAGALNYGNTLRWHIRAQSAADSAAQATLALQSSRWNEIMELLYGMNVEEYRIRQLLNGILLSASGSGTCNQTANTSQGQNSALRDCEAVYEILSPQYEKAVQRYSKEAALLHKVAYNATNAKWLNDANALVGELQANCNNVNASTVNGGGGDCAFKYNFVATLQRSASTTGNPLQSVYGDGAEISIPSYGTTSSFGTDTENQALFAPVQVDVITCSLVQPVIPNFFKMQTKPSYAIGRATATNVLFVQDWFEPGSLQNPSRTKAAGYPVYFQPYEDYGAPTPPSGDYADHNYYAVDFGGNAAVDNTTTGYFSNYVVTNEMSVRLGWWNSIPVHSANVSTSAPSCPTVQ